MPLKYVKICKANYMLFEIEIVGTGRIRTPGTIIFGKYFIKN